MTLVTTDALMPTDLIGRWRLTRRIDDHRTGETTHVTGTTSIERENERLRWHEQGEMNWHGTDLPVTRTLFLDPAADGWLVRFEDGRPFHPWRTGQMVEHPCAADLYRGMITGTSTAWTVVWHVTGPAKDYRIESRLEREEPG